MRRAEMLPEIESHVPGRFRLTALLQRRIQELVLSGVRDEDLIRRVMREAAQGEISLEKDADRPMTLGLTPSPGEDPEL
jgi:siroheme synthase (precorrin-2 oxidase/ferrochelatase)